VAYFKNFKAKKLRILDVLAGTTNSHLKRTISTKCYIHTVYLLMMGCKYARNM
jgi:hypothetical protein